MRKSLFIALLAASASFHQPAVADEIDDIIDFFVNTDGYAEQDAERIDGQLFDAFHQTGAMRPDGAASPLEKALLLVDTLEPPLPRVRYMVRYGQMMQDDAPVSFVTVERYNFGPLIRQETIDAYGEENTADPEDFGVGPHVAWRIVTTPLMGQSAAVMVAGRREIGDAEAASMDCGGRGCLSPETLDELHSWEEVERTVNIASAYRDRAADDVAVPARAAAELSVLASLAIGEGGEPTWNGPEHPEAARGNAPFLFVTIDRDLGQETAVDAAMGQTLLNDDAVAELWHRRIEFPGSVAFMQAAVQRSR